MQTFHEIKNLHPQYVDYFAAFVISSFTNKKLLSRRQVLSLGVVTTTGLASASQGITQEHEIQIFHVT